MCWWCVSRFCQVWSCYPTLRPHPLQPCCLSYLHLAPKATVVFYIFFFIQRVTNTKIDALIFFSRFLERNDQSKKALTTKAETTKNLWITAFTQRAGGAVIEISKAINYVVTSFTKDGNKEKIFIYFYLFVMFNGVHVNAILCLE